MDIALLWWIIFIAYLISLYVFYKILIFVFKWEVTKRKFSPKLLNGVRFFVRLAIIVVAFSTFIGVFELI